mgnify:CR=1 FL=1
MIYLIFGQDTYRSRKKLREIISGYREKNAGDFDFHRLDAEDPSTSSGYNIESLKGITGSQSLFSAKKLVVIENIFKCQNLDIFKSTIEPYKNSKETVIVLWDKEATKGQAAILEKISDKSQEYKLLAGAALAKWIREEAARKGVKLFPAHLAYLQKFGGDLWAVSGELDKILAGGETLVQEIEVEKNVFGLGDAFFTSRRTALADLLQLIHQGEDAHRIFAYLAGISRHALVLKDIQEKSGQLPGGYPIHPFVAKKLGALLKNIPAEKLKARFMKFFEEDWKIKTGLTGPEEAIEKIILG